MVNSKKTTSVTGLKPLDPNDWLRVITSDRERHQRMATPRGRLSWLFELGDRSGRDTEPGQAYVMPEDQDQDRLACEIALFLFMTGGDRLAPVAYYDVFDAHEELMRQAIRDLSTLVSDGINAFVDGKGSWDIPVDRPATRSLSRVINDKAILVRNLWGAVDVRDWRTPFMLAAADAVLAEAPNLRRCTGCGRVFVVDDPREHFHNKQCASKFRVASWRARPPKPQPKRSQTTKPKKGKVS